MRLSEKLEAADSGSRELDVEIANEAGWRPYSGDERSGEWYRPDGRLVNSTQLPTFSTSIDAALTLLPDGWLWSVSNMEDGANAQVIKAMPHGTYVNGFHAVYASTPALALCAAICRAKGEG